jgi:hypothetical protein
VVVFLLFLLVWVFVKLFFGEKDGRTTDHQQ